MKCYKSNIGYGAKCTRCENENYSYLGETSRTAYTRFKEHLGDYRVASRARLPAEAQHAVYPGGQARVKSWMWEHCRDFHDGDVGGNGGMNDYKTSVSGKF